MHKNIFFLIHLLTLLVNNNLPFCSPFYYTKILFTHLQFIHNIVETVYFFALMHKLCSIQLPHYLSIDYLAYRSLTNYRLWTPMLRFVLEIIKLCNVRERRVYRTEASPLVFVTNVHCILWTFWGYPVQPGALVL